MPRTQVKPRNRTNEIFFMILSIVGPMSPGFVYVCGRCNVFRFGFHSLPFIVINKKDRSEVII